MKNNTECTYDIPSKDEEKRDGSQSTQGIKRRRAAPRTLEADVDELQSIYGHLRSGESIGEKPDINAIESRLDKLMSMVERLGGRNQTLGSGELQTTDLKVEPSQLQDPRPSNSLNGKKALSRPPSPHPASVESSTDEFPIPSGQATDLVDPVGSLNLGHLSLEDGGRSTLVATLSD